MSNSNTWKDRVLANGRYLLLDKLGEGGMGIVFRAHDRNLDIDVVVKVPKFSQLGDDQSVRRFLMEVRSLVNLSHPHVVRILDVGEDETLPFAVMDYLSSGSLKSRRALGADGEPIPQPPETLSNWLPRIAAALDFAHRKEYIHRDVKPDNILFDAAGNAYLSDFGIAKGLSALNDAAPHTALTKLGMVLGTSGYMAPEALLCEPCDGRADQYSLAITVYEMLTGRSPFAGLPLAVIAGQQLANLPESLEKVLPGIPVGVALAVRTALSYDRQQRYPSCEAFARAVLVGADRPVSTAPVPPRKAPVVPPAVARIPPADSDKTEQELPLRGAWMERPLPVSSFKAAESPPKPAPRTARPRRFRSEQPSTSGSQRFKPYLVGALLGMILTSLASAVTWHVMKKNLAKLADQAQEEHEKQVVNLWKEKAEMEDNHKLQAESAQLRKELYSVKKEHAHELNAEKVKHADQMKDAVNKAYSRAPEDIKQLEAKMNQTQKAMEARDMVLDQVWAHLFSTVKSEPSQSLKNRLDIMREGKEVKAESWKEDLGKWMDAELKACLHTRGLELPDLITISSELAYLEKHENRTDGTTIKHYNDAYKIVKEFCEARQKDPTSALEVHRVKKFLNRLSHLRKP